LKSHRSRISQIPSLRTMGILSVWRSRSSPDDSRSREEGSMRRSVRSTVLYQDVLFSATSTIIDSYKASESCIIFSISAPSQCATWLLLIGKGLKRLTSPVDLSREIVGLVMSDHLGIRGAVSQRWSVSLTPRRLRNTQACILTVSATRYSTSW